MALNISGPIAYEQLSMIAQAYETSATQDNARETNASTGYSTLDGMDQGLYGQFLALDTLEGRRNIQLASLDKDVLEALGDTGDAGEWAERFLRECLNCSLRLRFDWQLKPLNFLDWLDQQWDTLKNSLDLFSNALDPFKTLQGICNGLNALQGFCIPDLIGLLAAIKLLLQKYIKQSLSMKLDWTAILGPLLKFLLNGLVSLMDGIVGLAVTPLDCLLGSLSAANQAERDVRDIIGTISQLDNLQLQVGREENYGTNRNFINRNFQWGVTSFGGESPEGFNGYPDAPSFGGLETTDSAWEDRTTEERGTGVPRPINAPVGFEASLHNTIVSAVSDPAWVNSTFIEKIIVAIRDARNFIVDLISQLSNTLESLNKLAGNGIQLDLRNLGIILFIKDMVNLILMIIWLLRNHPGEPDWCRTLERNPALIQEELNRRISNGITVESSQDKLIMRLDNKVVGEIPTCSNTRKDSSNQLIQSWLKDLQLQEI